MFKLVKNISNQRFGRYIVISPTNKRVNRSVVWLCKCDCGTVKEVDSHMLIDGNTKSCGCLQKEGWKKRIYKHGFANTKQYIIWQNMKQRCKNPKTDNYSYYGGRGITYDPNWEKFSNFWEDMKNGYQKGLSLDRLDSNGNYEKQNCKWSTNQEQSNNKKNNRVITFNGKTQTMAQWSRELKIPYTTISTRINTHGWSIEKAFTTPKLR